MPESDAVNPQAQAQEILAPPARAAIFLTLIVPPGRESAAKDALADVPALTRSVAFRAPEAGLTCVTGIGSDLWDRAYAGLPRPAHLHPFAPLTGAKHHAPATAGDLLFHLRADSRDICFELAHQLMRRFDGVAECVDEVQAFRNWDERDLLGFVDGSENPGLPEADAVALIGSGGDYPGGSYVVVQKYLHDIPGWRSLTVEDQERAVGRSKIENIEIPDDEKAPDAHIVRASIDAPDGTELRIVRENMPFGSPGSGEFGTYFIGYAADPGITERMLRRMFIGEPPGSHDRLLDFSTAHTGCLFFVPPADLLEQPESYA
ncbi:MAG: Dyp-type peroxidase [Nocardioides sp.]|uniref:Dyp-type peroxidase n=1 Tax=Nocardioides sp. TaxID=35761 RepID=UPI0039E584BA